MRRINRRNVLGLTGVALAGGVLPEPSPAAARQAETCRAAGATAPGDPANPYAAQAFLYTIVTPDLAASQRFYRDVMGYAIVEGGSLRAGAPGLAGVGKRGREYALLRYPGAPGPERGLIRLLSAAEGSGANRPRPAASIVDPGLALLECHPRDARESYEWLVERGVATISTPKYYYFDAPQLPSNSGNAFCAFGPAGEQLLFNCRNVPNTVDRRSEVDYPGRIGPLSQHTLIAWDRWPLFAFYGRVLGLRQAAEGFIPFDRLLAACRT